MEKNSVPPQLESSWQNALKEEFQKPYMATLKTFVAQERSGSVAVFPPALAVFNAFSLTPIDKVKVVIMGQDPYHGPGQAHGLSFSVPEGTSLPPSLQNIFKELRNDLDIPPPKHGCLTAWAKQGVLLLNATLTVRQALPMSHHGKGWEEFTDAVIRILCGRPDPLVFLLWGKSAEKKCQHLISENSPHLILKAPHPSPFSAHTGFLGCRHFSKTNEFLVKAGKTPIDWSLN
ncbi:MAG: uracil-DNA glycosylase [Chlamydiales bacterium]|nr:uracil-DNA glycosylase [Chlamydiales bacterium]